MGVGTAVTVEFGDSDPQEAPSISCTPFATTRAASTTATTQPCAGARLAGMSTMTLGENGLPRHSCPIPAAAPTLSLV